MASTTENVIPGRDASILTIRDNSLVNSDNRVGLGNSSNGQNLLLNSLTYEDELISREPEGHVYSDHTQISEEAKEEYNRSSLEGNLPNSNERNKGFKIKIQVFGVAKDQKLKDGTKFSLIEINVVAPSEKEGFKSIFLFREQIKSTKLFKAGETCEIYGYRNTKNGDILWTENSRVLKEKDTITIPQAKIEFRNPKFLTSQDRSAFKITITALSRAESEAQIEIPSEATIWRELLPKVIEKSANEFQDLISTEPGRKTVIQLFFEALNKKYSLKLVRKKGDREWGVSAINILEN